MLTISREKVKPQRLTANSLFNVVTSGVDCLMQHATSKKSVFEKTLRNYY